MAAPSGFGSIDPSVRAVKRSPHHCSYQQYTSTAVFAGPLAADEADLVVESEGEADAGERREGNRGELDRIREESRAGRLSSFWTLRGFVRALRSRSDACKL
jgi:hypothetical protein